MSLRRSALSVLNFLVFPYQMNLLARNLATEVPAVSTIVQKELMLRYQELKASGRSLPASDAGFRVYSQADEDGILLYMFSLIGFGSRRCVDIGASPGSTSNTANLILHHGFRALLIDGNPRAVQYGVNYYSKYPDSSIFQPRIVEAFVTPQNINRIISSNGFNGEIDLLSVDIDGLDYWVWEAIDCISPRIVVAEFNRSWPADVSVTVPNDPNFVMPRTEPQFIYHGASLRALTKLAHAKSYRLVACNNHGYNAFFMRNGEGESDFPEILPETCLPAEQFGQVWYQTRLPQLRRFKWIEV